VAEAFCEGHVEAFAFFVGIPQSILYDNTRLAVAQMLGDGKRERSRMFSTLQSHYLFEDKFGSPGKGNDKGKVEGLVGYVRRHFMVPMPVCERFEQRYERGSTLITSNLPFDEWTSVFGSERLTGALLDRLTHHVHILEMNGESFRLASSRKRQKDKEGAKMP